MKVNKQHAPRISYGVELFIVLMSLTGVYFIVSDFDLAAMTRASAGILLEGLLEVQHYVLAGFTHAASQLGLSDIVGMILIGATFILSILRIRDRLVLSRDMIEYCPQCGMHLARRHRTFGQKVIANTLGLTSASFKCLDCDFSNVIFRYRIPENQTPR